MFQFWQELAQQRWRAGGSPEPLEALYRRDKVPAAAQACDKYDTAFGVKTDGAESLLYYFFSVM